MSAKITHYFRRLLCCAVVLLLLQAWLVPAVHADGGVALSFGDLGSDYGIGDTVAVPVEIGSGDISSVSVNFTYSQNLLQFEELDIGGDFDSALGNGSCDQQTGSSGSVAIDCTTNVLITDTDLVAIAYFTVLAPGTANFVMTSGDIKDGSGTSIWDGQLASSALSLLTQSSDGIGSGDTGGDDSTSGSGASTGTSTATSGNAASAAGSTTTVVSSNGKTLNLQPGKGALLLTAVDDGNRPQLDAKVTLDGNKIGYTDNSGEFEFINLQPGQHTVIATKKGKVTTQTTFTVEAGKEAQVKLRLLATPPSPVIGYISLGILAGVPILMWLTARFPVRMRLRSRDVPGYHAGGVVVGSVDGSPADAVAAQQSAPPMQVSQPAAYIPPPLPTTPLPQAVLNPKSLPADPRPPGDPSER